MVLDRKGHSLGEAESSDFSAAGVSPIWLPDSLHLVYKRFAVFESVA